VNPWIATLLIGLQAGGLVLLVLILGSIIATFIQNTIKVYWAAKLDYARGVAQLDGDHKAMDEGENALKALWIAPDERK
jgi:hypothetical protein